MFGLPSFVSYCTQAAATEVTAARQRAEQADAARERAFAEAARATQMFNNLEQRLTQVGRSAV